MAIAILGEHGVGKTRLFEIITNGGEEDGEFTRGTFRADCTTYTVYDTPTYIMERDLFDRGVCHVFVVVDDSTDADALHMQYVFPSTVVHFDPIDPLIWEMHTCIHVTEDMDMREHVRTIIGRYPWSPWLRWIRGNV